MPSSSEKTGSVDAKIPRYRVNDASGVDMPTWGNVPMETIHLLVTLSTSAGDAVSFGKASEGAQLLLTVFSGGARDRLFWNDAAEAHHEILQICEGIASYLERAGSLREKASAQQYIAPSPAPLSK